VTTQLQLINIIIIIIIIISIWNKEELPEERKKSNIVTIYIRSAIKQTAVIKGA